MSAYSFLTVFKPSKIWFTLVLYALLRPCARTSLALLTKFSKTFDNFFLALQLFFANQKMSYINFQSLFVFLLLSVEEMRNSNESQISVDLEVEP